MRKKRKGNRKIERERFLWVISGISLLLLLSSLTGEKGLREYFNYRSEASRLKEEVTELRREIEELEQEIKGLEKDPLRIEELARERFIYSKEGEYVIILPEEPSPEDD